MNPRDLHTTAVLVVDDFPPMLTIVAKLLASIGIDDVDCAGTVNQALTRVHARDYDLLIVDYFLTDETGDDLLAALQERSKHIPAVIMTGEPKRAATKLGHEVDWLRKPFTAPQLRARIVGALAG
jgi:DNA-binding response OmpR family regulator